MLDKKYAVLADENGRLRSQFKLQEEDREYLIKQTVALKKENAALKNQLGAVLQVGRGGGGQEWGGGLGAAVSGAAWAGPAGRRQRLCERCTIREPPGPAAGALAAMVGTQRRVRSSVADSHVQDQPSSAVPRKHGLGPLDGLRHMCACVYAMDV